MTINKLASTLDDLREVSKLNNIVGQSVSFESDHTDWKRDPDHVVSLAISLVSLIYMPPPQICHETVVFRDVIIWHSLYNV